jgi:hypothetical protein
MIVIFDRVISSLIMELKSMMLLQIIDNNLPFSQGCRGWDGTHSRAALYAGGGGGPGTNSNNGRQ